MTNICNTLLALAAAAMVFGFAITWKPEIDIVIVLALIWFGLRWLARNHPTAAYVLVCFLRGLFSGLLGSRR
jgi:hypothetical protein